MKKIFYLLAIVLLFTGCSSSNSRGVENSIDSKNNQEEGSEEPNEEISKNLKELDPIEKALKELNLPLEGNHVFDPKIIKVGDDVVGFTLTAIKVTPATEQYPLDTVMASFSGEATISGTIRRTFESDEFFPDLFIMNISESSNDKLPVSHHDSRYRSLIFENFEDLKEQLDLNPGEEIEATIKIKDWNIYYLPTDASDTTTLIEVVEMEK